jgi:hypothetical protein
MSDPDPLAKIRQFTEEIRARDRWHTGNRAAARREQRWARRAELRST